MLHSILGNVYPCTMPGPPGEVMTRENFVSREWHQKSPINGHVTKFLWSEFQYKGNKQMWNREFSAKFCGFFSAATDSEHKIIQMLHRKGQNKIWTELSSIGQEPRIFHRKYSTKPCFDEVDIRQNDTSTKGFSTKWLSRRSVVRRSVVYP